MSPSGSPCRTRGAKNDSLLSMILLDTAPSLCFASLAYARRRHRNNGCPLVGTNGTIVENNMLIVPVTVAVRRKFVSKRRLSLFCGGIRRFLGWLFSPSCLFSVVRFIWYLGQDGVVRVRVGCFVPSLARSQIVGLGRARLRASTVLASFYRQLAQGSLLTIIEFRLLRGFVNAFRGAFERTYRLNRVSARQILASTPFGFPRRGGFVVRLLGQCIVVFGALGKFLRFIRFVMIDDGGYAYLYLQVLISVLCGDPDCKCSIMDEDSTSRFVRRSGTSKEGVVRGVEYFVRLSRGDEFSCESVIANASPDGGLVCRSSVDTFNQGRQAGLNGRNSRYDLPWRNQLANRVQANGGSGLLNDIVRRRVIDCVFFSSERLLFGCQVPPLAGVRCVVVFGRQTSVVILFNCVNG